MVLIYRNFSSNNGSYFSEPSRRLAIVSLCQLRDSADESHGVDFDALHRRHRTRFPLQPRCQPVFQRSPGPCHADRSSHGPRRLVQELRGEARLDLRVRHRGVAALQGGTRDPGARASDRSGEF